MQALEQTQLLHSPALLYKCDSVSSPDATKRHPCLLCHSSQRNYLPGHKSTEFYFFLFPLLNIHLSNGLSAIKLLRIMEAQSH